MVGNILVTLRTWLLCSLYLVITYLDLPKRKLRNTTRNMTRVFSKRVRFFYMNICCHWASYGVADLLVNEADDQKEQSSKRPIYKNRAFYRPHSFIEAKR